MDVGRAQPGLSAKPPDGHGLAVGAVVGYIGVRLGVLDHRDRPLGERKLLNDPGSQERVVLERKAEVLIVI